MTHSKKLNSLIKILPLLLLVLLIFEFSSCSFYAFEATDTLSIELINVGQGDAILLSYEDWYALIDTGPPGAHLWDSLKSRNVKYLNWVLITHRHLDHYGGLYEYFLKNPDTLSYGDRIYPAKSDVKIQKVYLAKDLFSSYDWNQFEEILEVSLIDSTWIGKRLESPKDLKLLTLWPPREGTQKKNNSSIVTELEFKGHKMLFMGDLEKEGELELIQRDVLQEVDFLKIAHHGSKSSSSIEFLSEVNPHLKALSYACENSYGHPHQSTLDHLKLWSNIPKLEIASTCQNGSLRFEANVNGVFWINN